MLGKLDWERYMLKENILAALFKSHKGHAISFYFQLEDDGLKQKYEDLVEMYGGRCDKLLEDIHPRTVVMVEVDYTNYAFSRPVFKVNYIQDCINASELLPLTDYLHNKLHKYCGLDFLDVIYYRTSIFKDPTNYQSQVSPVAKQDKTPGLRQRFSQAEKVAIIKFIIGKNETSNLKDDRIWLKMEKYNICPKRTYQSMKTHFLKYLIHNLHKFDFLTNKQKQAIREGAS